MPKVPIRKKPVEPTLEQIRAEGGTPVDMRGNPLIPERTEQLAICLFDIDRVDPLIRQMLLGGKLEAKALRMDEHRPDETAVLFVCSLLDAATTCDIVRNHDRQHGDPPTRVWLRKSPEHSWIRQPGHAVFSVVNGNGLELHPWTFPPPAAVVAAEGLKAEKMF